MAHKLSRLSKSILNEPHYILQNNLDGIATYLDDRQFGSYVKAHEEATLLADKKESDELDLAETSVGMLRVSGNLTYKPTIFEALCGGCSYVSLIEQAKELCALDEINTIIMEVDSGGGMAFRMMETAKEIKKLCNDSGKKLVAYVDGTSASAAFGLSVAADEIIVNPDSMVGSIGAVVALTDYSKQDEQEGIKRIYITSANEKVPFEEDGSFKKEYLEDIKARVVELGSKFVSHVAELRNISEDTVKDTNAKMFNAEDALELGLIDKIMTGAEFAEYLAELASVEDEAPVAKKANVITLESQESPSMETPMSKENIEASVDVSDEQLAKLAEMEATLAAQAEVIASFQAEKEAQAQATLKQEITESLSAYSFLAESKDSVVSFLASADEENKALLTSVLGEAQASLEAQAVKAEEELSAAKAEKEAVELASQEVVEEAQASKDAIKEEFAVTENADTSAPEVELTAEQMVQLKVKEKLAARKAAKSKA